MGRFEKVAVVKEVGVRTSEVPRYDPTVKSLLTDAQNEELRAILSQPIEIASDEEMREVFEDWDD
jgi:hypothetical protein